ncbi:MAG: hypothetical protein HQK53_13060 [Oligoflexia bacterium]|nr:hypothetical protein [Oligoflexia bacterium]
MDKKMNWMNLRISLRKTFLALVIGIITTVSMATEVDSFTQRYSGMRDSLSELDRICEEFILRALEKANSEAPGDEEELYDIAYKMFAGGWFWGNFETYIKETDRLDKRTIDRKDSIYSDLSFRQSFPMFLASLGAIYDIGGVIVGSDKFGHYFEEGYKYYVETFVEGKGVESALAIGEGEENGFFGMATTGIYSYGDLYANFQGMRFWKDFAPNPFNSQSLVGPYVIMGGDGKWKLNANHKFSWKDYIDPGWDEGINCNKYFDASYLEKINKHLELFEARDNRNYHCPVVPEKCLEIDKIKDYPQLINRLVSQDCIRRG